MRLTPYLLSALLLLAMLGSTRRASYDRRLLERLWHCQAQEPHRQDSVPRELRQDRREVLPRLGSLLYRRTPLRGVRPRDERRRQSLHRLGVQRAIQRAGQRSALAARLSPVGHRNE